MLHPFGVFDARFDNGLIAVRLDDVHRRPCRPIGHVDRFARVPLYGLLDLGVIERKRDREMFSLGYCIGDELMHMIMRQDLLDPAAYLGAGRVSAFLRGLIPREGLLDGLQLACGCV